MVILHFPSRPCPDPDEQCERDVTDSYTMHCSFHYELIYRDRDTHA